MKPLTYPLGLLNNTESNSSKGKSSPSSFQEYPSIDNSQIMNDSGEFFNNS